jgi:hypothetical protein
MFKKIPLLSTIFLMLQVFHAWAQQGDQYLQPYNNIWTFGRGYGLDFSTGTPVPFPSQIYGIRAAATLSNEKGELLCYSNGDTVWNRLGEVMPGSVNAILPDPYSVDGAGITGYGSMQGALFVPVIDNPDQFYLFSLQSLETLMDTLLMSPDPRDKNFNMVRLYYSVIDMSLENGKGDIVPGMKGILLDSMLGAPMIAVPGEDCNIWLLVHQTNDNVFKAYEISASGIAQTPVVSNVGHFTASMVDPVEIPVNLVFANATMKISPDNRKLALCANNWIRFEGNLSQGLELFDFDPATGEVSNGIVLDSLSLCWSACFSPDNTKLYVNRDDESVDQYDLTWPTTEEIIEYKTVMTNPDIQRSIMKLGPDGKIYFTSRDTGYIHVINAPDLADTFCDLRYNVIQCQPGPLPDNINPYYDFALMAWTEAMPNDLVFPVPDALGGTRVDTLLPVSGGSITFTAPQGRFVKWSDGSEDSVLTVNAAGTYTVSYLIGRCSYYTDTFVVEREEEEDPISVQNLGVNAQWRLVVYPNPAQESAFVRVDGAVNAQGVLVLTDALGRVVHTQRFSPDQQTVYLQHLPEGVYLLRYLDEKGIMTAAPVRLLIAR